MNLSQLYYFRKLAEVKHYTHAAEELFISQPTLSNSISQLERELGIPLFEREGRKIKLTRWLMNTQGRQREASTLERFTPSRATTSHRLLKAIATNTEKTRRSTFSRASRNLCWKT